MFERDAILQIFSRYLETGGEEVSVKRIGDSVRARHRLERCEFNNRDWIGPGAPAFPMQAWMMLYNPASLAKLRKLQREFNSSAWLVHNVFPVGSAAIFREALKLRIPIIYYVHNFRPFSVNSYLWADNQLALGGLKKDYWTEIRHGAWQNSKLKTAWFAFVLTLAHRLRWFDSIKAWVAISEFMRQRFIEAGVPPADIFTLRHSWQPMEQPPERPDNGCYLYLGRLIEAKGVHILFKTWKILNRELGTKTPTLVIAGDGPLALTMEAWCTEVKHVRYVGRISGAEKADLLAGCRAMIAPSLWWEPLGLVTYEAYDFAKPMLAARSGGLTETVIPSVTGMLHTPGDAEELAEQIMELDVDEERRLRMGREGRKWLLANTSEHQWLERFENIFQHALGRQ